MCVDSPSVLLFFRFSAETRLKPFARVRPMGRVILRPTILSDLPYAIGEPLPYPIRAITATVDGRVIGLGGIAFPPQGPAIAFAQLAPRPTVSRCSDSNDVSQATPEAKRYPVAFHRAGLLVMAMIRELGTRSRHRDRGGGQRDCCALATSARVRTDVSSIHRTQSPVLVGTRARSRCGRTWIGQDGLSSGTHSL